MQSTPLGYILLIINFIVISFLRSNKASMYIILVRKETVLEINCSHLDMSTVDVLKKINAVNHIGINVADN